MPDPQPLAPRGFAVRRDQPLIGILVEENGQEKVRYFTDEGDAQQASTKSGVQRALDLFGAWSDLGDWADVQEELDRIRHQSKPTPPIDEV